MEKNLYNIPEIKFIDFCDADVIATSGVVIPDDDGYSEYYPDPILP